MYLRLRVVATVVLFYQVHIDIMSAIGTPNCIRLAKKAPRHLQPPLPAHHIVSSPLNTSPWFIIYIYVRLRWRPVRAALSVDCPHTVFVWHTTDYCRPVSTSPAPLSSSPQGRCCPKAAGLSRPLDSREGIRRTPVCSPVQRSSARMSADFWRRRRILNVCTLRYVTVKARILPVHYRIAGFYRKDV